MPFECKSIILKKDGRNQLTGYHVEHEEGQRKMLYLEVEQIVGVTTREISE